MITRRQILQNAALAPAIVPAAVLGQRAGATPPSDKVVFGGIGIGTRGAHDLSKILKFDDARFVAVCDVRDERREEIKSTVDKAYGDRGCKMYDDQYEILAREDIDAVLIATGDRWHTPLSIWAAKAGKDIYCEKPVSLTVAESRAMADTMARYGTVYQAGHQRRSVGSYRFQIESARKGMIGQVHTVVCQVWEGPTIGPDKPRPVPDGFDYDMWLGTTPWHPYTQARVNGWNYFWDTGAGPLIGMGCHYTDIAQWGLERDDTGPLAYEGTATWKPDAFSETPVTAECYCTYADGIRILLRSSGQFADRYIRFVGSEGWIQVDDQTNAVTAQPESILRTKSISAGGWAETGDHVRNWLDCIKSRKRTVCHPESAHRATTICHAVNIGLRLGRSLRWDPAAERFVDDDQANAMLLRAMRPPWSLI
jgi:predicted dehydrogenase